jgi:hypothetical protein
MLLLLLVACFFALPDGVAISSASLSPSSSASSSCGRGRRRATRSRSAGRSHSSTSSPCRRTLDLVVEDLLGQRQQVAARVDDLVLGEVDPALEDLAAQRVDALALLVHHVVVLEQVLADGEVLRLHLLLRALDRLA